MRWDVLRQLNVVLERPVKLRLIAAVAVSTVIALLDTIAIALVLPLMNLATGSKADSGTTALVSDLLGDVTNGSRTAEALVILWGAAAGSALVDNIPFTAAMIPVTEELTAGEEFDDTNWWALALGACFGGNATLIAAAANVAASGVMDRSGRPLSFVQFFAVGAPVTVLSLVLASAYLLFFQL